MSSIITDITFNEIDKAATTLTKAFSNDPLMSWILPTSVESREDMLHKMLSKMIKYAVLYGIAIRTQNFEAVAIRKIPGDHKESWWRLFRSGMIKIPGIIGKHGFERLMQFEDASNQIKHSVLRKSDYVYCWMLGTLPEYQHQGFGSVLIEETFNRAKSMSADCYLEVANFDSKMIHTHKGYELQDEFKLADGKVNVAAMLKRL